VTNPVSLGAREITTERAGDIFLAGKYDRA
jgi:hypothetical protein